MSEKHTASQAFKRCKAVQMNLMPAAWDKHISFRVPKASLREAVGGKIRLLDDPDLASWRYNEKSGVLTIEWAT